MTKIHQGLENRDIMNVSPGELGIVTATTCAVSGQLATDACYNDSMGYGTVTDYWYEPTVPSVYCQMHQAVTVCAQSGMPATEYCPATGLSGAVVIPAGHPLSVFASDPEYAPVIAEYLGTASSLTPCVLHSSEYSGDGWADPVVENTLIPDAQQLLQSAYDLMAYMDPSSAAYYNLQSAASALESLIYSNPTTAELASGMAMLTQAMAGAY